MSTPRPPQPRPGRHRGGLDDAVIERLLRGDPVSDPAAARLARVLAAAAAPATKDDLRYAEDVCAAYSAPARRRRKAVTVEPGRTTARLLGLKLAIAAVAAAMAGGVAFAASAGIIPMPLFPSAAASPGKVPPRPVASRPRPSGSALSAAPLTKLSAEDIAQLCAAYQAITPAQRAAALDTPAFAPLVAAAGSATTVPALCATSAEHTPAPPSRHPTGKPTAPPSHPPTTRVPARQAR